MNKSKTLEIVALLLVVSLLACPHLYAQSESENYKIITDVLDGLGGESQSDNYKIPVNSGGQPSAIGISQSNNYILQAGYVHTSHVKRGDANGDGIINVGDVVYLVTYLYKNGPAPNPLEAGDCNCDGIINVGDIVYLVSYLYKGGPAPGCP